MWAIAAQHKKYNDSLSDYNSLKDPHLNSYFRKPQIRRHLLRANIINKDNKIVEEISSTKHLQHIERKQKKELYHLLEELINRNEQFTSENSDSFSKGLAKPFNNTQEDLIKRAKIMFEGVHNDYSTLDKNSTSSNDNERSVILQRLDRMIRAIKEYDHIRTPDHGLLDLAESLKYRKVNAISNSKLKLSKSYQDISNDGESSHSLGTPLKSFSSSSHLAREFRPKSSYGRQRRLLNTSQPDLAQNDENELVETIKKSKSVVNIASYGDWRKDSRVNDEDIESVEGDSWSDHESDHGYSVGRFQSKSSNKKLSKKYFAFDKKFVKNSSRQRMQMTLKYNGLNGATNRGVKRNVKVFQQVAIGGNSILIYDGYVAPGDLFTIDIRPHPGNSCAIIIMVDGIRDLRMNTCCEHKHRPGTKLSHFTFVDMVGGRPCFACQNLNFVYQRADSKKYLDYFTFKTKTNDSVFNGKDAPEDLNDKKVSVNSTDKIGYLDKEKPLEEIHTKYEKSKIMIQNVVINSEESIHDITDNNKVPEGEDESTGNEEQAEQVKQLHDERLSHLEEKRSSKDNSKDLIVISDELEQDMKTTDYHDISDETLPQVASIDSDSDDSLLVQHVSHIATIAQSH